MKLNPAYACLKDFNDSTNFVIPLKEISMLTFYAIPARYFVIPCNAT